MGIPKEKYMFCIEINLIIIINRFWVLGDLCVCNLDNLSELEWKIAFEPLGLPLVSFVTFVMSSVSVVMGSVLLVMGSVRVVMGSVLVLYICTVTCILLCTIHIVKERDVQCRARGIGHSLKPFIIPTHSLKSQMQNIVYILFCILCHINNDAYKIIIFSN